MAITGTNLADVLNGTTAGEQINGLGGNDTINGDLGNDTIDGGNGSDSLIGGIGNDFLTGGAGNDTLDGGAGNDAMTGGANDDTYVVNSAGDGVTELANEGTDTVRSSVSYALGANSNLENLTLTGTSDLTGTGNELNNVLTGNSGKDSLVGGLGNDTYVVNGVNDVVTEQLNEGTDTVQSSVDWILGDNLENLTLTGAGNIKGTGNSVANVITGNDKANILTGGGGDDILIGGLGNDTYIVDSTGDVVTELANAGADTVKSSVSFTLHGGVETLLLTGTGDINGTGNGLANTLTGNSGANLLVGAAGEDVLNGSGGRDTLNGGADADQLLGGGGADRLIWDANDTLVNGGGGNDTLQVTGATALDLTGVNDAVIQDVEIVNLAGTNTLTLAATDVLALSSTTDTLRVVGGTGDAVHAGAGWAQIANTTIGANEYVQYARDGATLQVDLDIDRSGIAVSSMSLSLLDGTNGFQLDGVNPDDKSGWSVASAGDVDGDGYDDLIVGAPLAGPGGNDYAGETYVVFGNSSFGSSVALGALNGTDGFRLEGATYDERSGHSVASAGDVNGDGFDDLIIGAYRASPGGGIHAGETYVVFGQSSFSSSSSVDLGALDGTSGFRLDGVAADDSSGSSVASAGDVNGDGFDDVIIGAWHANGLVGESYVVFGKSSFGSSVELSALDGANGFRLDGADPAGLSGFSVASAGDVNGDGFDDMIIGAYNAANPGGYSAAGKTYVVFGSASGFAPVVELSSLDGTNSFRLDGIDQADLSGHSVASAGDVNGDGYDDLIIGAHYANGHAGESYVVFGNSSLGSSMNLGELDGTNGFRLDGVNPEDKSGFSVASAGDFNGDGYDDLIIGAFRGDPGGVNDAGETYVVFGSASGFGASVDLGALDGTNGFRLDGDVNSSSGRSVNAAGDVNGDGYDDLVVGAQYGGVSYVVYGRDWNGVVDFAGTALANTLTGTGAAEVFVAGLGNDTLTGGGGADAFHGGRGNDRIEIADAGFLRVDGGSGTDTLALAGSGMALDLTAIGNSKVTGIEIISLNGSGNNTLTLDALEVLNLSGTSNTLRVMGSAGDAVHAGAGWTQIANTTIGLNDYAQYTQDGTTLQVDTVVDRSGIAVSSMSLSLLDGTNGFRLDGVNPDDRSGWSVASAGDVDGDGFDDVIIGANYADDADTNNYAGVTYVVFGQSSFGSSVALGALDGTGGFRLEGIDVFDHSGGSVASAGDVNGDGFVDVIIGADRADPGGDDHAGETYVVFGQSSFSSSSSVDLGALDGTSGFRLDGVSADDSSGNSVASAGDVNGDGFDDLIIGARGAAPGGHLIAGETYVVFGQSSFASSVDLGALNGTTGFRLDGANPYDFSGFSVASAGDVNGDGFDDMIIGVSYGDPGAVNNAGESYVVFGHASGFAPVVQLSALNGTNSFRIDGIDAGDNSGWSVASAGDVNGDGYDDLVIGAPGGDPGGDSGAGETYVVFGNSSLASSVNLGALNGTNGFRLDGIDPGDSSGWSVASAGDFNGDGYDDLIIGASLADPGGHSDAGETYVVFGKASGFGSSVDLGALDGTNGFRLDGIDPVDHNGWSVNAAGDVNGDGFDDLIMGAYAADPGSNGFAGESYVVYGRDWNGVVDFAGTAGINSLNGTAAAEVFVGGQDNDTLAGGGGADVFRGGADNDTIELTDTAFFDIDGGSGNDSLVLVGSAMTLDLTAIAGGKLTGIEQFDITGGGNNTLTLALNDVLHRPDTLGGIIVIGDAGDTVNVVDGVWNLNDTGVLKFYDLGSAHLIVSEDVTVNIALIV